MKLNIEVHKKYRCCFALHKIHLHLVPKTPEDGVIGYRQA